MLNHCTMIRALLLGLFASRAFAIELGNPLVFVTQMPIPQDFTTVNSSFGNHDASLYAAGRGGDLWIRYPDGELKNLTQAAGYGQAGMQGARAIAVRDPSVHWNGRKLLFSMAIGAPTTQWGSPDDRFVWQIYEISGLGKSEKPTISRVAGQPGGYNNINPLYSPDGGIVFASDRPRDGRPHLYPQRDEYELAPTATGLWKLTAGGRLQLLTHAPSGDFNPFVDSFGRLVFTRWDHLQQDQFARADRTGSGDYGTFNYASEAADAAVLDSRDEVFPEPLSDDPMLAGTHFNPHTLNHFFPWQVNPDGTELETLNHIGRHELHGYFGRSFNDDPALNDHLIGSGRANQNPINNFLQLREDPDRPGRYYGIDAPEFGTHASGQIIRIDGAPSINPDKMAISYVTHRDTAGVTPDDAAPPPTHSGLYRHPSKLSGGTLIASHTFETRADRNEGTSQQPASRYAYRLRTLKPSNGYWVADQALTPPITKRIEYRDTSTGQIASYDGELWQLQATELRQRPRPPSRTSALPVPERRVLTEEGIAEEALRAFLRKQRLALIVVRNATSRDGNDRQQPFNLRVAGTTTATTGGPGKLYDIAHMQIFQGDQIRGFTGWGDTIRPGRRVLPTPLHGLRGLNAASAKDPAGSVKIAPDGSIAALVPANRALTWQTTDTDGAPIVRERVWLSFQAGEIRVCGSCHGVNTKDQAGQPAPANRPEALRDLLGRLRQQGQL